MAKYNLFSSIKRAVASLLRLTTATKKPTTSPTTKAPKPKAPKIAPEPPQIAPVTPSQYEKIIEELKRQNEELKRRVDQLEQERITPPAPEPIIEPAPILSEDDLPYMVEEDTPAPSFEYSEDDLPYMVKDDETIDTTYKNLGSEESLNVLIDFLKDYELSGIPENSAFFGLTHIKQRFMLLDYIQYQHDANPSLFYKGKKALALENVPIWGEEFERFVNNSMGFDSITSDGADNIDVSFLDDLIESI